MQSIRLVDTPPTSWNAARAGSLHSGRDGRGTEVAVAAVDKVPAPGVLRRPWLSPVDLVVAVAVIGLLYGLLRLRGQTRTGARGPRGPVPDGRGC